MSALHEDPVCDADSSRQSGIVPLLSSDMAVMVDESFLINDLVPYEAHQFPSLSNGDQMSAGKVLGTQSIAHVRVCVERLIRRIKENKQFDTVFPLSISGSINHIFTVACLLSNYQKGPLVKKWRVQV